MKPRQFQGHFPNFPQGFCQCVWWPRALSYPGARCSNLDTERWALAGTGQKSKTTGEARPSSLSISKVRIKEHFIQQGRVFMNGNKLDRGDTNYQKGLFFCVCGGHIQQCLGIMPGWTLKNYFWRCLGDYEMLGIQDSCMKGKCTIAIYTHITVLLL